MLSKLDINVEISNYIEYWNNKVGESKHNQKLLECFNYVQKKLSTKTKTPLEHPFMTPIRTGKTGKHKLYLFIQRSKKWKAFAAERKLQKRLIMKKAEAKNIISRVAFERRSYSDLRMHVLYGVLHDSSRRRVPRLICLNKSNNRFLAIKDDMISTAKKRSLMRGWLIHHKIVAVTMCNLKFLKSSGIPTKSIRNNFMALLDMLKDTSVFAVNFGENDNITECKPFQCLIQHIKDGGNIRRYYICDTKFKKKDRVATGFPNLLRSVSAKEKSQLRGTWIECADDKVWAAVTLSKADMGKAFVSKQSLLVKSEVVDNGM